MTVFSSQQLVLGEINATVSFWPDVRDNDLGPDVSLNILAIWSHLRRFKPESLRDDLVCQLNGLIEAESDAILAKYMQCVFPADWISLAEAIDVAWDDAVTQDEADNLTRDIIEHFELLDRHELALCTANSWSANAADLSGLEKLGDCLNECKEYLADHIDVFLPAAPYAIGMLASYRQDLDTYDASLWETTWKHRRLEEMVEERDWPQPHNPEPELMEALKEEVS
jgi:hypothetical protein